MSALLAYLMENKLRLIKFAVVYLGNPILFLMYLFSLAKGSLGGKSVSILGMNTFSLVSTNVYRMNLLLFLMITIPIYLLWVVCQVAILQSFSSFQAHRFLEMKYAWLPILVSVPGLFNLLVWSTSGMEGNIFGFIFGMPMLGSAAFSVGLWIYHVFKAF